MYHRHQAFEHGLLLLVMTNYSMKDCVLLQYMVLYQLGLSLMFNVSFFMDGFQANHQQVRRSQYAEAANPWQQHSMARLYMRT